MGDEKIVIGGAASQRERIPKKSSVPTVFCFLKTVIASCDNGFPSLEKSCRNSRGNDFLAWKMVIVTTINLPSW